MRNLFKKIGMGIAMVLSFSVHAQTCTVSSLPVTFGSYDPFSSTASDISGSVTVTCNALVSLLVSYTVKLNEGLNGTISARKMTNGSSLLSYQLYSNSGRTAVWGDGTSGSSIVNDGYLISVIAPVIRNYSVYGRISARQNVNAGSYVDTVTILLTY